MTFPYTAPSSYMKPRHNRSSPWKSGKPTNTTANTSTSTTTTTTPHYSGSLAPTKGNAGTSMSPKTAVELAGRGLLSAEQLASAFQSHKITKAMFRKAFWKVITISKPTPAEVKTIKRFYYLLC